MKIRDIVPEKGKSVAKNGFPNYGKIPFARGSRQVVRHQPSKLIFVGSNPISRSLKVLQYHVSGVRYVTLDTEALDT